MRGRLAVRVVGGRKPGCGPVVDPRPLRAVPTRDPLPCVPRGTGQNMVDAPTPRRGLDPLRLGSRRNIAHTCLNQHSPEAPFLAIGRISGHPGDQQRGVERPQHHRTCQFGPRRKRSALRNSRLATPITVIGPGLGQMQLPVDQGPPPCRGIGCEHADLAVLGVSVNVQHPRAAGAAGSNPAGAQRVAALTWGLSPGRAPIRPRTPRPEPFA